MIDRSSWSRLGQTSARRVRRAAGDLRTRARTRVRPSAPPLPSAGFPPAPDAVPLLDRLDDAQLAELNGLLPWRGFTVDGLGRRFGDRAWPGKRDEPQPVPPRYVTMAAEQFDLAGKHVFEVGCFEGIHTIGLCRVAGRVTAVDSRVANVVKTIVRAAFYGARPDVFVCDVEAWDDDQALTADVWHHVGVLYHLRDPVRHLLRLGTLCREGLLLDTHVADEATATESMTVDGRDYRYRRYAEGGAADHFSGAYDHAKWLLLADVVGLLERAGFARVDVLDERAQRNGPRVTLVARRS